VYAFLFNAPYSLIMSTLGGKKYGLILPSKKVNVTKRLAKPSVFGDSSSDEEGGVTPMILQP